jgi:Na+/melibiose symporter-like transporter
MRKLFLKIHPTNFSLVGGTLLGSAFGGIISILSTDNLEERWYFLLIACLLFSISGVLFNVLSIKVSDIQISIESILRIESSTKTREELQKDYYKENKSRLILVFMLSILFSVFGFICLFFGPIYSLWMKNCG